MIIVVFGAVRVGGVCFGRRRRRRGRESLVRRGM
jgi:hypothetical protein